MQIIEKLGAFYLGQVHDLKKKERNRDEIIMYDARDLTTHAVCVGMTGSGKTGLCIDLLEEAALDSVPAIIIDPKGDMANLLLTFPDLRPADFEPWINVDDARRKGMDVAEYARTVADQWRNGLADWGQGPERIRALKESVELRVFTPGSDAGRPVSILSSLKAPALSWDDDTEALREQIQDTVSALLGLIGVSADPLRSREHILLANLFEHYWRLGQDLDLALLITAIQNPPVRQVGVFDVDTFFPEKDRFGLAIALNNIMAAPGFATWIRGEPLDIADLWHSPSGKPRHSIFYIAHLNDAERMFFVTLLLGQLITWMRSQSGTTSLRALLYFDELFGFFPPVAEPPSKRPLLTLLKQARAFGLGVVLTTQNPVDLDYKGLTNAGTWFIGKLQTEQDKARVLDGLQSAAATAGGATDRRELDRTISEVGSRVFLLHNVHGEKPVTFQTRWAMSYLRGPLTRSQIRQLVSAPAEGPAAGQLKERSEVRSEGRPGALQGPRGYSQTPPALPPDMPQYYLPAQISSNRAVARLEGESGRRLEAEKTALVYEPCLLALGEVAFVDSKRGVDERRKVGWLVQPGDVGVVVRWQDADPLDLGLSDLEREPEAKALFGPLAEAANTPVELKALAKDFADYLYREQAFTLYFNPILNLYSRPGESERDFKARAQQTAREKRDQEVDKLRKKAQQELDRLETQRSRQERDLDKYGDQHQARKRDELLSAGESVVGVLGLFGGRRRSTTALTKASTKRRLTATAKAQVKAAEAEIERLDTRIEALEKETEQEAETISGKWTDALDQVETTVIKPRRTDVRVELVSIGWAPYWEISYRSARGDSDTDRVSAWR
jgi:hypothetical protein